MNQEKRLKKKKVTSLIQQAGFDQIQWVAGKEVVVNQWVRLKCQFGCSTYGNKHACPPYVPSITECRELFAEYDHIAILHISQAFKNPEDRYEWGKQINKVLLGVEREIFLAGFPKVFLLFMDECCICKTCSGSSKPCKFPDQARPSPEALGVDVFTTVRKTGFPINVLTSKNQNMNRYSFILVA